MLDPEIQNIIERSIDLEELLDFDYLIRDRIFTGDEVLEILEKYSDTKEYDKLKEAKEEIEEKLDEMTSSPP